MNKIAVFCSGSDHIAPVYREKAEELGAWLGRHHKWLVYGGSDSGLMEVVGKAVKGNGGMLMGIIPTKLEEAGRVSGLLDVEFRTVNLSDRKDMMLQEAEVAVALPGGIGTLDEVFHVAASASIGYHDRKVILYNVEGFWDDIIRFLGRLEETHFAHRPIRNCILVADTFEELIGMLEK
ncbi:MAG TPA: TIGR00730 family Rossman fold protein [Candidatus Phocaeicola excrementigallinarum]|nr:TIGR00730 family Rossman fold protein [Candidatus Phocaeicola excrementigallinarum]